MTYKCLIVDDEPLSRKVLENHIKKIKFLELSGQCDNAIEAINFLSENQIDLIFLDINMPELSGMEFLKSSNNLPNVIITTAYSEYALESYEYSVKDYLLKPISFSRFVKAVNKLVKPEIHSKDDKNNSEDKAFIFVKCEKIIHKIFVNEIVFIESVGNYIKIHTKNKNYLVQETLSNIILSLPITLFVRSHKSFIVSLSHIQSVEGNMINVNNEKLPIGRHYRQAFIEKLNEYSSTTFP